MLAVMLDPISDRGHEVLFAIFLSFSLCITNVGQLKFEGYYSLFFLIGMCACFPISQWKSLKKNYIQKKKKILQPSESSQDPVVVMKFEFCAHSARLRNILLLHFAPGRASSSQNSNVDNF